MEAGLRVRTRHILLLALVGVAGCDNRPTAKPRQDSNAVTVDVPQAIETVAGVTPMAERVAVIGLLNKRNGIVRDLTLKPGQAIRVRDAVVRLRACETSAPWENDRLTGACVQLDVEQTDQSWRRVFSGWLYKESPSLNVVEHPVYDVWPKSCAMRWPDGAAAPASPSSANKRSSAPKSGSRPSTAAPAPDGEADPATNPEPTATLPEPSAAPSNPT